MINGNVKYIIALIITMSSFNLSAAESAKNPYNSADWYFAVRTNLNSAAIITGIAASWNALCNVGLPLASVGIKCVCGKVGKETVSEAFRAAGPHFKRSLFLAGLAIAIEGVNKLYFRPKYYAKIQ